MLVKTKLLIVTFFVTSFLQAQLKITLSGGLSNSLAAKPDSLFFAKKNSPQLKLNTAYYWGRLGLGTTISSNTNTSSSGAGTANPPSIPDTVRVAAGIDTKQGKVSTTIIAIGPEICLCYKKLKIMPSIKVGVAILKTTDTKLLLRPFNGAVRKYETTLESRNSLVVGLATTVAYKLSSTVGVALAVDYWNYKIKAYLADYRAGNNTKKIAQPKSILNAGLGLYFNLNSKQH
jgi:hypothetical protein